MLEIGLKGNKKHIYYLGVLLYPQVLHAVKNANHCFKILTFKEITAYTELLKTGLHIKSFSVIEVHI